MKNTELPGGQEIQREAVIQDFSAPEKAKKDHPVEILVSGSFSNLSWKLKEAFATVNDKEIILSVIGTKKSGTMAAQALKPYETKIIVKDLKRGNYTIKASKGTDKSLKIKIR